MWPSYIYSFNKSLMKVYYATDISDMSMDKKQKLLLSGLFGGEERETDNKPN